MVWTTRDQEIYNRLQKEGKLEHKDFPAFVVNIDSALGQVEAIVSVMGVRDMVEDVIHPGAYVKTITERTGKIRVLDNHRTDSAMAAIGRPLQIKELRRNELPAKLLEKYPEATGGLWTLSQFDMDTPEGSGLFKRLASGTLNEWSIGFDVLEWDKSKTVNADGQAIFVRNIRQIRLWEYSVVLWGANQATMTVDAKGAPTSNQGENKMPVPSQTNSVSDAPNYHAAPDGYDRCKTCYFFDPAGHCTKYDFMADPDNICDSFKAGSGGKASPTPTDGKTVEGIEESMGATLIARVYDKFIAIVNGWLSDSDITLQEHRQLMEVGGGLVDFITSAVSAEIMAREIDDEPYMDMLFWAAEGAQNVKRLNRAVKAGRVLSQANATKLVAAVEQIQEVLTVAGIYDQAESADGDVTDDSAAKNTQPTTQAGPRSASTLSSEADLQKSFLAARQALAELKGETGNDLSGKHPAS